jgi:hypothetical protein
MYQSVLCPSFTLGRDGTADANEWQRFDAAKYKTLVCELAVEELEKLLERLPADKCCVYIPGTASVYANYAHNILDRFYFKVRQDDIAGMDEARLQEYLCDFYIKDWEAEFGAAHRISEFISSNYGVGDFHC